MVWPPATGHPASRATSAPPRSTSASRSRSSTARGHPTRLIAMTHSPPMAHTSDIALAATMRPQSNGSSTTGVKKSAVLTTARPPSSRTTAASSPLSAPTSRSGPPGRSTPARSVSSSPIGTLQAHPPPAAYCVIRTAMPSTLAPPRIPSPTEAYRRLVALPVFNTGEAEQLGLAGSIPVRLRQTRGGAGGRGRRSRPAPLGAAHRHRARRPTPAGCRAQPSAATWSAAP